MSHAKGMATAITIRDGSDTIICTSTPGASGKFWRMTPRAGDMPVPTRALAIERLKIAHSTMDLFFICDSVFSASAFSTAVISTAAISTAVLSFALIHPAFPEDGTVC